MGMFRWSKEDQKREVFSDTMELVLDIRRDKNDAARAHRPALLTHLDLSNAPQHVIDFVFGMGLLGIAFSCMEDVKAHAKRFLSHELEIGLLKIASILFDLENVVQLQDVRPSPSPSPCQGEGIGATCLW